MIWLGIDTANKPLSVAVVKDGELLAEENIAMPVNHSLRAMPAIEELLQKVDLKASNIDRIAVSEGPGSYTGVRIGVTIAKTLAWTLKKPLQGVSSLKAIAMNGLFFNGLICPLVDARRKHVYAGVYESDNENLTSLIEDGHYAMDQLLELINEYDGPILFIGTDVSLHKDLLIEELGARAVIAPLHFNLPRASSLIYAAQQIEEEEDIHHFVPEYRRIAEAEANWLKAQGKEQNRG